MEEGEDAPYNQQFSATDGALNGRILANGKEAALVDGTTHKYNVQEFVLWCYQKFRVNQNIVWTEALKPTEQKLLAFCQERKIVRESKNVSKKQRLASGGVAVMVAKADIKKVGQSVSKYYQYLVTSKVIVDDNTNPAAGNSWKAYMNAEAKKQAVNFKVNREDPHKGTFSSQILSGNEYRRLAVNCWSFSVSLPCIFKCSYSAFTCPPAPCIYYNSAT